MLSQQVSAIAGALDSLRTPPVAPNGKQLSPAKADVSLRTLSLPAPDSKIKIGICAMDKKARSKPMLQICERLLSYGDFEIEIFGDECILNKEVEEWPEVQCLLSWFSDGFPLHKACAYVELRRPYLINRLHTQEQLLDRRAVYEVLQRDGILVPAHIVVDRDGLAPGEDPPGFEEHEDYVQLGGVRISKPFVEKPVSGEDHNIYIYYPHNFGGGVKMLFRKRGNQSSQYVADHPGTVRRAGSYIYESFLTTAGTDVKVYTVGPQYAHAEARKSPVVDGKVLRTPDGKEIRYPVLLTPQEKEIAHKVVLAFGQKVCGFDLLRTGARSYVCDVNGWSFVKNSTKYYDDAAGILHADIIQALAPHRLNNIRQLLMPPVAPHTGGSSDSGTEGGSPVAGFHRNDSSLSLEDMEGDDHLLHGRHRGQGRGELRCVLAVIRHGDRTPKQKVKVVLGHPAVLALYRQYQGTKAKQAKLKSPQQLSALLQVTRQLVEELRQRAQTQQSAEERDRLLETWEKLRIVRTVLEQEGGRFAGINRKAQLKPLLDLRRGDSAAATAEQAATEAGEVKEVLLIFKWGGVLTHAGRAQAEALGGRYRKEMYPSHMGGGLLRLHSTYRHDFKIFASDEGRVQTSAAAFTKALLDLEGTSLTPILVSMIDPQKKQASMLDAFGKGASGDIRDAKAHLVQLMQAEPPPSAPPRSPRPPSAPPAAPPKPSTTHPLPISGLAGTGGSAPNLTTSSVASGDSSGAPLFSPPCSPPPGSSSSRDGSRFSEHPAVGSGSSQIWSRILVSESESESDMPPLPPPSRNGAVPAPNSHEESRHVTGQLPANPREQLAALEAMMGQLVAQLRPLAHLEVAEAGGQAHYSSLAQAPTDWQLDACAPCCNERVLLLLDRWLKLRGSFYSRKRDRFDITKIPDIYDSAKYDALHNSHLGVDFLPLYFAAKELADVVIPCEYGLGPAGKLCIGSKICKELVGKLLCDMGSMREESRQSLAAQVAEQMVGVGLAGGAAGGAGDAGAGGAAEGTAREVSGGLTPAGADGLLGRSFDSTASGSGLGSASPPPGVPPSHALSGFISQISNLSSHSSGATDDADGEPDEAGDHERMYHLDPDSAPDIFAPSRHVRTRIYFTSESHIHSLLNVLRYCHLAKGASQDTNPIIPPEGQAVLDRTPERDYLTQIVFRMYEDTSRPLDDPSRFRVEVWFSPGTARSPAAAGPDHLLHPLPLCPLHPSDGAALADLEAMLDPLSKKHKYASYAPSFLRAPAGPPSGPSTQHTPCWSRSNSMVV